MEVTLALGILTFVFAALIGVFAVGARADRQSVMEMEATQVIQTVIAGRRARPVADNVPTLVLPRLDTAAARDTTNPVFVDHVGRVTTNSSTAEFGLVYRVAPTAKTNGADPYSDVYCAIYWPAPGLPSNSDGQVEFATRIPLP